MGQEEAMIAGERDLEAPDLDATVLVVGHGSIGSRHVRNLLRLGPGIVVVESLRDRLASVPDGIESWQSWPPMSTMRRITHAIIATPASEHGQAMADLGDVRSVLVEKPLLVGERKTTWHGLPLGEIPFPRRADARWSVGFNLRQLPSLRSFREQVQSAPLGRILYATIECSSYAPEWRTGRAYASTPTAWKDLGGGALRECSHEVDLARWIFGQPTVRTAIVERTHSLVGDSDDYAFAILSTPYCERVELRLDLVRRDARRRIEVVCERGTLTWDIAHDTRPPNCINGEIITYPNDIDATYVAEVKALLSDVVPEWADPNVATLEDGLAAVRLVDDIEAAAK